MVSSTLALLLFPDFQILSRAAAPEGQFSVEYRGYFCPSIRPLILSAGLGSLALWPWSEVPGLEALAWRLWLGALGLRRWPRGPGFKATAWEPLTWGPGLEALP